MKNNRKMIALAVVFLIGITAVVGIGVYSHTKNDEAVVQSETVIPAVAVPASAPSAASVTLIRIHTVKAGESLSSIAADYNIDIETLYGANTISNIIRPGDQLKILPQKGILHVVQDGETLWSIARLYGISVALLMNANNKNDNKLAVAEELIIPGVSNAKASVSRGSAERMIWPTYGELSSPFGYRWGKLHAGLDIANEQGTFVKAALHGKVTYAGWQSGYGYTVVIEHSPELSTLYGHLSGFAVAVGQIVEAGQIIAYMGSTGNSTGPHLHFEVRKQGHPVNPLALLP